ncbi:MAG: hypothetical protein JXB07_13520 [Anaerolineae bacterium]|nr:hypothetical protein [Anaerolineae bacterium]
MLPTVAIPEVTVTTVETMLVPTIVVEETHVIPTVCSGYGGTYVADVTISDGMEIEAGTSFTKVWRVRSDGCVPWPEGTVLSFDHGSQMGAPANVPVPQTSPGTNADISVGMIVPATAGEYEGYWQLQSPDGVRFGPNLFVKINSVTIVPLPATTLDPALVPTSMPLPVGCGDGTCNGSETFVTCPADCGLVVLPVCGDGVCNGVETMLSCPADCGIATLPVCGDGVCNSSETFLSCPADCKISLTPIIVQP